MLVRAPSKRPDAHTILRHEFLRGGAASSPEAPLQPEILNRMKRFADMNRFKKEALRVRERAGRQKRASGCGCVSACRARPFLCLQVVATHLPPEEIEGIRQMFQDMDTDGSGAISFEELREGKRMAWLGAARKLLSTRDKTRVRS
jgi:calcium-dependent protein kinase